MLLSQNFKTLAGAQKRARFENAHVVGAQQGRARWSYNPVRCVNGEPDMQPITHGVTYTWRLRKTYLGGTNVNH